MRKTSTNKATGKKNRPKTTAPASRASTIERTRCESDAGTALKQIGFVRFGDRSERFQNSLIGSSDMVLSTLTTA